MKKKEGFLLAYPDRLIPLQTTYTPSFLGLEDHGKHHLWDVSNYGTGVIIGVLDTGILPNHTSFNDKGMPLPSAKWKGRCEFTALGCNRKLIGVRTFVNEVESQPPFDSEGHRTHTTSTAAGKFVYGARVYRNAPGVAFGMAPRSHLEIYKVCVKNGCRTSNIVACLDAAVGDGVDVLSLSIGGKSRPFYADGMAIGAFGAIQKGVFVSCSAGNSGPNNSTLSNEAPWIMMVGTSMTDRLIRLICSHGDGQQFNGESLNQAIPFPTASPIPLVYPSENSDAAICKSLQGVDVRGKAVVCDMGGGIGHVAKGSVVEAAGGVAVIVANTKALGYSTLAEPHVIPASHVSYEASEKIKAYINSTSHPVVTISRRDTLYRNQPAAPMVSYFSSRGPSQASPNILKSDIIRPGVNVLAACTTKLNLEANYKYTFNIISGTSMASPHLSGIVGLLKAAHP
ncbi:Tripeptidyl-peptidase II protein [Dioscorea alata]|uniref:Tripeptidyl-peptidase II protein n=1 Tax=Dioscorea alata TaxID=55571 RepID=A0ACB7WL33_DIOAL|nr:Tripeptidyl-peptidase II protein [Dioscorea alata]